LKKNEVWLKRFKKKKTRANQENYNQKRTTATIIYKSKKKEWLDQKIYEIEHANKHKNVKKFYSDLKEQSTDQL